MIDKFVDQAKKEVPEKLEESVQSTFVGRIATDASTFNRFVVYLPLAVILAVNMSLAALQVYLSFQPKQEEEGKASKQHTARHLRRTAVPDSVLGVDIPKSFHLEDIMPYVQP